MKNAFGLILSFALSAIVVGPAQAAGQPVDLVFTAIVERAKIPNSGELPKELVVGSKLTGKAQISAADGSETPLSVGNALSDGFMWPDAVKNLEIAAPLNFRFTGGNVAIKGPLTIFGTLMCTSERCKAEGPTISIKHKTDSGSSAAMAYRPKTFRLIAARPKNAEPVVSSSEAIDEVILAVKEKKSKLTLTFAAVNDEATLLDITLGVQSMGPKK